MLETLTIPLQRMQQEKERPRTGSKGKVDQMAGSPTQDAPLESMLASLKESITGLTQKHADMEKAMATQQEKTPMAKEKMVSFEEDQIEEEPFELVFKFDTTPKMEGVPVAPALEEEMESSPLAHYFSTEDPEEAGPAEYSSQRHRLSLRPLTSSGWS